MASAHVGRKRGPPGGKRKRPAMDRAIPFNAEGLDRIRPPAREGSGCPALGALSPSPPRSATGVSRTQCLYSSRPGSRSIWRRRLTGRAPDAESCKLRSSRLASLPCDANDCGTVGAMGTRAFFTIVPGGLRATGCGGMPPGWCETSRPGPPTLVPNGTRRRPPVPAPFRRRSCAAARPPARSRPRPPRTAPRTRRARRPRTPLGPPARRRPRARARRARGSARRAARW